MSDPETNAWDRVLAPWWAKLVLGGITVVITILTHRTLAEVEAGEAAVATLSRGTRIVYEMGGKWLATGLGMTIGLGFLAWGIYQFVREQKAVAESGKTNLADARRTALEPPAVGPSRWRRVEPGQPVDGVRDSYFQALYVAFWRVIFLVVGLANMLVACLLLKQIAGDPVQYAYAVAILIAIPIAYFELELFARAIGWDSGPIIDLRERATILVVGGYAIALALAVTLAMGESRGRRADAANAEAAEREKAQWRAMLNNPDVKRAEAFIRAEREAREARESK